MNEAKIKRLFYFSLAVLLALILFWFGSKFLFFTNDRLNDTQLFIAGILSVIGGIFMLTNPAFAKAWGISVLIIISGFYFFARSAGIIEMPWLARILGVAAWLAAAFMLYFAWPGRQLLTEKDDNDRLQS